MGDNSTLTIKNIVVFGGTGAQGSPIVRALSATNKFAITIPTRNPSSPSALLLSTLPNVHLLHTSYTTTIGLRACFANQDACYFSLNSFTLLEAHEYFWTFRAYEIAVQSGLKWFVLSGGPDRLALHDYEEKYRNSHGTVSARLSGWLENQPLRVMKWTVVYGGVYAQMLSNLLAPREREDGVYEFAAPIGDKGVIPFMDLNDYGIRTAYIFSHPSESIGKTLGWAPWYTTYPELVTAFVNVTGKKVVFRDVSQEEWFERMKGYVDPEMRLPMGVMEEDGEMAFSFRETFGAWWNLWRDGEGVRDWVMEREVEKWSDLVEPGRARSIEEWMRRSGYTGEFIEVQKAKIEDDQSKST